MITNKSSNKKFDFNEANKADYSSQTEQFDFNQANRASYSQQTILDFSNEHDPIDIKVTSSIPLVNKRFAPITPQHVTKVSQENVTMKLKTRELEIHIETLNNKHEFLEQQHEEQRKNFEKRLAAVTNDQ